MDDTALVNLPLPMATAMLCAAIALLMGWLDLGFWRANVLFSAFFGLGAVTSLLVGLRFGYAFEALIPLQRTLPLFFGPMMYLSFKSLAVETRSLRKMLLWHLGSLVVLIVFFVFFASDVVNMDWVIIGSYAAYGLALYLLWRKGPDALINARVDMTGNLSNWLLRGIGFLVFILVFESAISIDFAINQGANASRLISYGTIPLVLSLLGTLAALPMIFTRSRSVEPAAPMPETEDAEIVMKLQVLMRENKVFLDPDITVQRLAKRLGLPARTLSGAVNRTQGMNMSQYVNTFRLAYAADQLAETCDSVTKIATRSGFTARSNFYREFQRVYGQSPIEYRASSKQKKDAAAQGLKRAVT